MGRIIGRHIGEEDGPLLVLIGAMHGNEPAGVRAIELLLKMLEVEPIKNPDFSLKGNVIGVIGNYRGLQSNQRFIHRDMNRCWSSDVIESDDSSIAEYQEIREVFRTLQDEIAETQSQSAIVLDLHTTSSKQGIFVIPSEDQSSLEIAKQLHAPVVLGITSGMHSTSLHFFNTANMGIPTIPVVFESGQHIEPLSVNRAIAAIINCMRTIGMVREEDVENIHDKLLIEYSKDLPRVVDLVYGHPITPDNHFSMQPGYANFDPVNEGEWIANDIKGKIFSPYTGRVLMPLYQAKGEDGFFIVQEKLG